MKVSNVSFMSWSAVALFTILSSAALADDPPKMGTCGPAQKEGDKCALGICTAGKQTVYTCANDKQCVKSDKKADCVVPKPKS
jgi:hypothetical protein